jgi:hypothetical protein
MQGLTLDCIVVCRINPPDGYNWDGSIKPEDQQPQGQRSKSAYTLFIQQVRKYYCLLNTGGTTTHKSQSSLCVQEQQHLNTASMISTANAGACLSMRWNHMSQGERDLYEELAELHNIRAMRVQPKCNDMEVIT